MLTFLFQSRRNFSLFNDLPNFIRTLCLTIPGMLIGLTVHEFAHGYMADRFGDPTPRRNGRLTLNPLSHLDVVGTLALVFFRFGWAKPVPVNPLNLKNPRQDMLWIAAAGPLANLILATLCALIFRLILGQGHIAGGFLSERLVSPVVMMFYYAVYINVMLAIFNLLPIHPLDGSSVLGGLLPPRYAATYSKIEPYGFLILIGLLVFNIIPLVIVPPINILVRLLVGFSL